MAIVSPASPWRQTRPLPPRCGQWLLQQVLVLGRMPAQGDESGTLSPGSCPPTSPAAQGLNPKTGAINLVSPTIWPRRSYRSSLPVAPMPRGAWWGPD